MSFDLNYWTTAKYRYSFTDDRGDSRTVEIHKFGYDNGGAPLWANITDVEANGRGSVGTRWRLSGDDEYSPFMESETTFKLYDTGEALATDLLDEINEVRDKFLLLVREGDDIKWIGKVEPDSISFKEDGPVKLSITATDGLGRLADLPYIGDVTTQEADSDSATLTQVIAKNLAALGYGFDFYVSSSLKHRSVNFTGSGDENNCPLEFTWVNELAFTGSENDDEFAAVSRRDTLEAVLTAFGLRCFQAEGAWHIIQVNHLHDVPYAGKYRRWRYASSGLGKVADNGGGNDYEDIDPRISVANEELYRTISTASFLPAYSSVVTQYNHGKISLIRRKGMNAGTVREFENWLGGDHPWVLSGSAVFKTREGDNTQVRITAIDADVENTGSGLTQINPEASNAVNTDGAFDTIVGTTPNTLSQTTPTIQGGTTLSISLSAYTDAYYMQGGRNSRARPDYIFFKLYNNGTGKYAQFDSNGTLEWTATNNWCVFTNVAARDDYVNAKDLDFSNATSGDGTVTITLGPIFENESYENQGDPKGWNYIYWDEVDIKPILADGERDLSATTSIHFVDGTRSDPKPKSIQLSIGDGPTVWNKGSLFSDYALSTSTADWEETTSTHSDTDTNVSLTTALGEMVLKSTNKYRRVHSAGYAGHTSILTPLDVINRTSGLHIAKELDTNWATGISGGSWYLEGENAYTSDLVTGIASGFSGFSSFGRGQGTSSSNFNNRVGDSFDTLMARESDRLATVTTSVLSGDTIYCTGLAEDLNVGDPVYFQRRDTGLVFKRIVAAIALQNATSFTITEDLTNDDILASGDPILPGSISGLRIDMDGVKIVNTHLTNDGLYSWEEEGEVDDDPDSDTYGKITQSSTQGWIITRYGDAEFNDIIVRGMIEAGTSAPIRIGKDVGDWDDTGDDLDTLEQHGIWINLYNHWLIDTQDSDAVHFKVGNATDHFYWDEATAAIKVKSNGVDIFDSSLTTSGLGLGGIIALDTDGKIVMGDTTDGTILSTSGVDLVFDRAGGGADAVVSIDWEDDEAGSAVSLGYSTTYNQQGSEVHDIDDWSITSAVPVIIDATGDITLEATGGITLTSSGSLVVGALTYPKADGNTAGQVLYTNGEGVLTWSTDPPTNGQVLAFKSSDSTLHWINNGTGGGGGATDINDLGDVSIVSAASGDVLRYNGTTWVDYADSNFLARANHTGTQTASTISDFDTEVSNNTSVASNTTHSGLTNNPHSVTAAQLSLVVGTDVQAHSATLDQVAAGTYTGNGGALDNQYIANGAGYVTSGGIGTVQSVATSGTVNGLTLTGGPITSTGTITLGGSVSITASQVTDFDTEVSNNTSVSANTSKLAGIASGAEVNVQSDWNAVSGDAFILNKPTIGSGTVTSVATSGSVDGLTLTGGTITTSGTITLGGSISITESQVSDLGAYITGITSESVLSLTDVSGTPADKHLLYYDAGSGDYVSTHLNSVSADIGTVGTITSGTWWGSAIADAYISSSATWNTAYGWGNHANAGYVTHTGTPADKHILYHDGSGWVSETLASSLGDQSVSSLLNDAWYTSQGDNISVFTNNANYTASGDNISVFTNDSGYLTGITAQSVLSLTDVSGSPSDKHLLYYDFGAGDFVSTHLNTIGADLSTVGTITSGTWWGSAIADAYISSSADWNEAHGWGDHSTAGYQTSSSMLTSFANMVNAGDDKLVYMPQTPASGASVVELGSNVTISGGSLYASVSLTADVTGTLPVANGGTGLTSLSTLLNSNVTQQSLSVEVGVDVQAYSSMLAGFANLLNAGDDKIVYMPESPATAPSTLEFGTGLSHSAGAINVSSGTWITSTGTIASGTWQGTAIASAYIGTHNHSATDITSGTLAVARGGTGVTSETAISEMVISSFSSQTAGSVSGAKSGSFAYESAAGDAYAISGGDLLWEDDGATDTFNDTEFQTVDGGTQTEYRQRTVTVTDGQITAFGSWGSWNTVVVA